LANWTADPNADRLLADLIERVCSAIPSERVAVYLMGSFASGDASAESDVDAAVIWIPTGNTIELVGVGNAAQNSRLLSGKRLDPLVTTVSELDQPWMADKLPGLLAWSRLLHGPDLLAGVAKPAIDAHLTALRRRACSLMKNIRDGRWVETEAPLPDPNDPYFGYTRKRTWYPVGTESGTREIIELVAGLAAPLAVALTHEHVTSKRAAIESYIAVAEEPWANFVSTLYQLCAVKWRNRIPASLEEKDLLREMCSSVQAFENHYLEEFPCD